MVELNWLSLLLQSATRFANMAVARQLYLHCWQKRFLPTLEVDGSNPTVGNVFQMYCPIDEKGRKLRNELCDCDLA